ncbi:MAG: A/G-specific DNA-adenine glycosylase [Myxococcales bacterium]|nr:A/G-specific DNA-adenine glycosylase [Myxococcales bacterium]
MPASSPKRREQERGRTEELLSPSEVATVRRQLLRWGKKNFQHYPWRSETDPWRSFLAEFLLQRTRASQVAEVFVEVSTRFPTAESLARGGLAATSDVMARLGLHFRAPLLASIAASVAESGGQPPESEEELRAFTGVGMYTSAAWLSLHRGKRASIIDANVARWLSRMTGMPYNRDPRKVHWVQTLAQRMTPRRAFRAFNYAVLDFTMIVCKPREPSCAVCPVRGSCAYMRGSTAAARPGTLRRA